MDQARKLKLQKAIFTGLLVIFGVGLFNSFKVFLPALGAKPVATSSIPRQLETLSKIEAAAASPSRAAHRAGAESARGPVHYTASEFRDPLVSLLPQPKSETGAPQQGSQEPVKPPPVAPTVKIEGLLWGGRRPQVLIDGKLYDVGDKVQESQIVSINRDGVTVVNQGVEFVLRPPRTTAASAQRPMMEHGR